MPSELPGREGEATIVIAVTFDARQGHESDLRRAALKNASSSRELESGCIQFDLVQLEKPSRFMYLEQFADAAALKAHFDTEHYRRWRRAVERHVVPGSMTKVMGTLCMQLD